jgi:glycosyltransferase involved in cell wall biosynthesis
VRFLLLNQTFYPDVASTAQHLSDLALGLVQRGHTVTVLASRRAYDEPAQVFPKREMWRGVRILRVSSTAFGKDARWRRAADFASFMSACAMRLVFIERPDVVVALTSPPLISFVGACLALVRRCRFVYWVMDLNPDEAVAAGWLKARSLMTTLLEFISRWSLQRADKVIVLDRFMRERIAARTARKVHVIPPWAHDGEVKFDAAGRERFRQTHGLTAKFVVMYSGNHSPCHPLDTLLEAAQRLADVPEVVFCFVGGGSEWRRIRRLKEDGKIRTVEHSGHSCNQVAQPAQALRDRSPMSNVLCLPYQPLSELSGSLSAADLHVVVMGEPFVGLVHPCKVYNILQVGAPVLYIGPRPSHVSDLAEVTEGTARWFRAKHGSVESVLAIIELARKEGLQSERRVSQPFRSGFSKEAVLPRLIEELEKTARG